MGAVQAAQFCGMSGREEENLLMRQRNNMTMQDWVNEGSRKPLPNGGSTSSFPAPLDKSCSLEYAMAQCPDGISSSVQAPDILAAILALESVCRGDIDQWLNGQAKEGDPRVEVMINEPGVRYCICHDPNTPIVTAVFWVELAEITVEQAARALGDKRERKRWDGDSQFDILKEKQLEDPLASEITFHVLRAPWPFWDREVLQRRSRLPLGLLDPADGEGVAFVTQSVDDPSICQASDSCVRAIAHMAGHLLRPLSAANAQTRREGIEITVCQKLDIGGITPPWAHSLLSRFASKQGQKWAERLRQHCLSLQRDRVETRRDLPGPGAPAAPRPEAYALWDRELMGQ